MESAENVEIHLQCGLSKTRGKVTGRRQVRTRYETRVSRFRAANKTCSNKINYLWLLSTSCGTVLGARVVGWARAAGRRGRQLFACSAKKVAQHPLTAFKAQAAKSEREKNRRRAKRSEVLAAKNCGRLTEVTKQQQQQRAERLQQHAKGELQRSAASDGAR